MTTVRDQQYEVVAVDDVRMHPDNAKRGDVRAIAGSIGRNGFYGALVVQRSTGYILVGNHRWLAAREEGLSELPVIFVDCDADEARRIMVADNRTAELGEFDNDKLLELLRGFDGDLIGTGYSEEDLLALLGGGGGPAGSQLTDPDEVPEEAPARTVPGDVWLLGPHRLMCGDSTSPTDLDTLLDGGLADLAWTDPPYGVSYVGKTADALTIDNDGAGEYEEVLDGAFDALLVGLRPGAPVYVAAPAGPSGVPFARKLLERSLFRQRLVWVKDALVLGHSDYHYRHEDIYYGIRPGAAGRQGRGGDGWFGDNSQTSVLEFARPKASRLHPTMKPVELIAYCVGNSSQAGSVVLDLFGGSGSTLIACHATSRVARLMELDPRYVDVICRRWQEHTGILPVHAVTGREHSFTMEDSTDGTARPGADADEPASAAGGDAPEQGQPAGTEAAGKRRRGGASRGSAPRSA